MAGGEQEETAPGETPAVVVHAQVATATGSVSEQEDGED